MPYGLCVASGAVVGFISMALLAYTETPRATPVPIETIAISSGSSVSSPSSVVLERSANLMFDSGKPVSAPTIIAQSEMLLPVGHQVIVRCVDGVSEFGGRLETADDQWLELDSAQGQRVWIARRQILSITGEQSLPTSAQ